MPKRKTDDEIWIETASVVEHMMRSLTIQADPVANRRLVCALILEQDRLLGVGEAAKRLGVTTQRLWTLVDQGMVQALRFEWPDGRHRPTLRIPESATRGERGH